MDIKHFCTLCFLVVVGVALLSDVSAKNTKSANEGLKIRGTIVSK